MNSFAPNSVAPRSARPQASAAFHVLFSKPVRRAIVVDSLTLPPVALLPPVPVARSVEYDLQADADRELLHQLRHSFMQQVAALRAEWRDDVDIRLVQARQVAVELALTITAKIIHQQLTDDTYPIESMVREMIANLADDRPMTVALNPDDIAMLTRRLKGQPLIADDAVEPRIVGDATLGRGNCRVEGRHHQLFLDLANQLAEVKNQVLRSLGHVGV